MYIYLSYLEIVKYEIPFYMSKMYSSMKEMARSPQETLASEANHRS